MRLVTRGDLDGLTSAVLISTMEEIDSVELIHPQDITDKKFTITGRDIMANLPYHPDCAIWFDHHELTKSNEQPPASFKGKHAMEPSVARVIYNYYSSDKLKKFEHLVNETDRFDSANLTIEDVTDPRDVILLGFTIDSRSGMGSFKEYFIDLVAKLKTMSVEEILKQPEVSKRVNLLRENNAAFLELLRENSRQADDVVVTDFRGLDRLPVGNRFLVYTLFPETKTSVRLQWGPDKKFVAVTLGHNIFNKTSKANCGQICSDFGGGGHKGAAACPLEPDQVDQQVAEIIERLKRES